MQNSVKNNPILDAGQRKAAVAAVDAVADAARTLAAAMKRGQAPDELVDALLERASVVRLASSGRIVSVQAQEAWNAIEIAVDLIARAFGKPTHLLPQNNTSAC